MDTLTMDHQSSSNNPTLPYLTTSDITISRNPDSNSAPLPPPTQYDSSLHHTLIQRTSSSRHNQYIPQLPPDSCPSQLPPQPSEYKPPYFSTNQLPNLLTQKPFQSCPQPPQAHPTASAYHDNPPPTIASSSTHPTSALSSDQIYCPPHLPNSQHQLSHHYSHHQLHHHPFTAQHMNVHFDPSRPHHHSTHANPPPPPPLPHSTPCTDHDQQLHHPHHSQPPPPLQPPHSHQNDSQDNTIDGPELKLSPEETYKLLSFSMPTQNYIILDQSGRQMALGITGQLHGVFFLAETSWPVKVEGGNLQAEVACYRRNFFQVIGTVTLPRDLCYIVTHQGEQIPIVSQELTISAIESVEGSSVKIITLPWKSSNRNNTQPSQKHLDKIEKEPQSIPLDPNNGREIDEDYVYFPVSWKRLQFRIATANNGRRKQLQQRFVIKLKIKAALSIDTDVILCEIHSASIIVRGRSPRNFQAKKDVPIGTSKSASGMRKIQQLMERQQQQQVEQHRLQKQLLQQQNPPSAPFQLQAASQFQQSDQPEDNQLSKQSLLQQQLQLPNSYHQSHRDPPPPPHHHLHLHIDQNSSNRSHHNSFSNKPIPSNPIQHIIKKHSTINQIIPQLPGPSSLTPHSIQSSSNNSSSNNLYSWRPASAIHSAATGSPPSLHTVNTPYSAMQSSNPSYPATPHNVQLHSENPSSPPMPHAPSQHQHHHQQHHQHHQHQHQHQHVLPLPIGYPNMNQPPPNLTGLGDDTRQI